MSFLYLTTEKNHPVLHQVHSPSRRCSGWSHRGDDGVSWSVIDYHFDFDILPVICQFRGASKCIKHRGNERSNGQANERAESLVNETTVKLSPFPPFGILTRFDLVKAKAFRGKRLTHRTRLLYHFFPFLHFARQPRRSLHPLLSRINANDASSAYGV